MNLQGRHTSTSGLSNTSAAPCQSTAPSLFSAIVGSRLDYCNGILYGVSEKNIKKLQMVQNTLARVVMGGRRRDSITPMLRDLHWLPVPSESSLKWLTLTFKIKSRVSLNICPRPWTIMLQHEHWDPPSYKLLLFRARKPSWLSVDFPLRPQPCGTVFHLTFDSHWQFSLSNVIWKLPILSLFLSSHVIIRA